MPVVVVISNFFVCIIFVKSDLISMFIAEFFGIRNSTYCNQSFGRFGILYLQHTILHQV